MSFIINLKLMLSLNSLNKVIDKVHLSDISKSFKECLHDNKGGFLIPTSSKITDIEFQKYRYLEVNWSIPPITKDLLPAEFSPQAVKTVDMFRRKTIDLDEECMILFDYITGNIVSCNFSQESEEKVESVVYPKVFRNMRIASAHNHPIRYYSPPSGKNFQMLGFDFEDYELIFARNELWILESKNGILDMDEINYIREKADNLFNQCYDEVNQDFEEGYFVIDNVDDQYGSYLLNYLIIIPTILN